MYLQLMSYELRIIQIKHVCIPFTAIVDVDVLHFIAYLNFQAFQVFLIGFSATCLHINKKLKCEALFLVFAPSEFYLLD